MKKTVLIKGILVLLVITLLTMGFTGCGIVISTTGTVYVTIANDNYWYDIYIDGIWQDETNGSGNLTILNVPIGDHLFEAYDSSLHRYGYKAQYIHARTNNVRIYTY